MGIVVMTLEQHSFSGLKVSRQSMGETMTEYFSFSGLNKKQIKEVYVKAKALDEKFAKWQETKKKRTRFSLAPVNVRNTSGIRGVSLVSDALGNRYYSLHLRVAGMPALHHRIKIDMKNRKAAWHKAAALLAKNTGLPLAEVVALYPKIKWPWKN